MASRILTTVCKLRKFSPLTPLIVNKSCISQLTCTLAINKLCLQSHLSNTLLQNQIRGISFLVTLTAEQLWKGATSVSNAGRKRGRGRGSGRIPIKDLNRGQIIGVGNSNMLWPGLNSPIIKGKELVEMKQLPPDPEREKHILKMRDEKRFRRLKLTPIERGWSGHRLPGRSIGPPDPIGEDGFEGFDTKVLEFKTVMNMSGTAGRVKRLSAFVVTGNGNGIAGYALSKAPDGASSLRKAKNRAGKALMFIERFNNHTVYHNFYAKYGRTKIFVFKKPEGYGLVCHRALKTICEVIGIKNMYAKVEGSTGNVQNLCKAFFHGLVNQKTHQTIADETGLNIVELRPENDFYPTVVAAPGTSISQEEHDKNKLDYKEYLSEGRHVLKKKKWPRFYVNGPGWNVHLNRTVFRRNQEKVRINTLTEKGEMKSYLSDRRPDELPILKGIGKPRF